MIEPAGHGWTCADLRNGQHMHNRKYGIHVVADMRHHDCNELCGLMSDGSQDALNERDKLLSSFRARLILNGDALMRLDAGCVVANVWKSKMRPTRQGWSPLVETSPCQTYSARCCSTHPCSPSI